MEQYFTNGRAGSILMIHTVIWVLPGACKQLRAAIKRPSSSCKNDLWPRKHQDFVISFQTAKCFRREGCKTKDLSTTTQSELSTKKLESA